MPDTSGCLNLMKRRKKNIAEDLSYQNYDPTDIAEFKAGLKEWTLYLVVVSFRHGNPGHLSVLFTRFQGGGYWELHNNAGGNVPLRTPKDWPLYIKVVRCLGKLSYIGRELDA